jgi:predicted transposase/invertase (TIGR01784 family)
VDDAQLDARREGLAEGRAEGLAEGREEGRAEGREEERERAYQEKRESARRLKDMGIPPDKIAAGLGLTVEEIGRL